MSESIVIVGAGQAGGWAAKTLRDQNYAGKIFLLGEERHPPYERPPLSKDILLDKRSVDSTYLFTSRQLQEFDIDHLSGVKATSIDRYSKTVSLSDGKAVSYDRLMLATGSRVRKLRVEGGSLLGIHYLRGIDDAIAIRETLVEGSRLLVVGGGWIGLEVAAAARQKKLDVVVIETSSQICSRVLPADIARHLQEYHEARGVRFVLNAAVTSFTGVDRMTAAELSNGTSIAGDSVVVGIGVIPNEEIAKEAGLAVDDGIIVDASGRTSDPAIFAAGDVANQPNGKGGRIRIESWSNAQNQAISTAKAMLGANSVYEDLPSFWSNQFDLMIQILGTFDPHQEIAFRGNENESCFVKCYMNDGVITTAVGFNSIKEMSIVRRLIQRKIRVEADRFAAVENVGDMMRPA